jgi:hypothetical protein
MSIPLPWGKLQTRFATVRPWAAKAFPDLNRCAVCMSYVLAIEPSKQEGDATLADLPGAQLGARKAGNGGPGLNDKFLDLFFIRAAELLPRVQAKFGAADVEGRSNLVWPRVEGKRGVLYLEDCYQTEGDKKANAALTSFVAGVLDFRAETPDVSVFASGDHWDLFDGSRMVADGNPIRNNRHPGKLFFWAAA